jgi:hypothetical protein
MAQHDYVIDNQSSSAARTDLNNLFQAIVSQNGGATAPSTTYANMIWYDSANDLLKMRNEANSGWITLGTIDQSNSVFNPNFLPATQAEAEAGTNNAKGMTPLRAAQAIAALAPSNATTRFGGSVMTSKSRAMSTTYQNTTGGWLVVSVTSSNNGQAFYIGPSSASFYIATTNQSGGAILGLVPPSYYYLCTGSVLSAWYEGQA